MRPLLAACFLFCYQLCCAQTFAPAQLAAIQRNSWHEAAYRVPADSVLRWLQKKEVNFNWLNTQQPVHVMPDSLSRDSVNLPNGQYIWISSSDGYLNAEWEQRTGLSMAITTDNRQRRLVVFSQSGMPQTNAKVLLGKRVLHGAQTLPGNFILPKKIPENGIFRISAGGDTLITSLEEDLQRYYRVSASKGRWKRLPVIRQLFNLPRFIQRMFDGRGENRREGKQRQRQRLSGFTVFSKPLYKPLDTLRSKAWITDRKGRPLTQPLQLTLAYTKNGERKTIALGEQKAVSPGSYLFQMVLADSLPNDTYYSLEWKGAGKFETFNGNFRMEEYTLPDISTFTFNTLRDEVLRKDTMRFEAAANDANGLPLLDANVRVTVLSRRIDRFFSDTIFVPDTLYTKTFPLLTEGSTPIAIPAMLMPAVDMEVQVNAELVNSSNEVKTQTVNVKVFTTQKMIRFKRVDSSIHIHYTEDGVALKRLAAVSWGTGDWKQDTLVWLPCALPIHPMMQQIETEVYDELGRTLDLEEFAMPQEINSMLPNAASYSRGDTIGFTLQNNGRQTVYMTLLEQNKIRWQGSTSETTFTYHTKASKKHIYILQMRYVAGGIERKQDLRLSVLYNLLQVNTQQKPVTEPGGTDSMLVKVTDYKDRPMGNVNITAVGQNTQLKDKFVYPNLPLRPKYRAFTEKTQRPYRPEYLSLKADTVAKPYTALCRHIGLDSMAYYQWLFTTKGLLLQRSRISSVQPEVAVHAFTNGHPTALQLIYINRVPVWYYAVNVQSAFSQVVKQGFVQIGIRTSNAYIEIDSVYMQPWFKHDVLINLDSIRTQKNVRWYNRTNELTSDERTAIQQYFVRFDNVPQHNGMWLWQGANVMRFAGSNNRDWIAGPFERYDSINAFTPGVLNYRFPYEAGYRYRLTQGVTRLERMQVTNHLDRLYESRIRWSLGDTIPNLQLPPVAQTRQRIYLRTTWAAYNTDKGRGTLQLQWPPDSAYWYSVLVPYDTAGTFVVVNGKTSMLHQLKPGRYRLISITENNLMQQTDDIYIKAGGVSCVQLKHGLYTAANPIIDSIRNTYVPAPRPNPPVTMQFYDTVRVFSAGTGNSAISGRVTDAESGIALPGVSVIIRGTGTGTVTDMNGHYSLRVNAGKHTITFNYIGYITLERQIAVKDHIAENVNAGLQVSNMNLSEVVVVGYGVSKRKSVTGSVSTVAASELMNMPGMQIDQALQGRLAGVSVGTGYDIRIRGAGTFSNDTKPLYVIDGVLVDELPAGLNLDEVADLQVLKSAVATSLYGARAANGVIVVTTGRKTNGPVIRTVFRDDAYWQPNTITDKAGNAVIPIQYPENITSWQHMVYAAAAKGRYGRAFATTKAFKATQGLITVPQFLVEGDSVNLVGKAMNYAEDAQRLSTTFKAGSKQQQETAMVASNASSTITMGVAAPPAPDTIRASFQVQNSKGAGDGEQRTIPVFATGVTETVGKFWVLDGDTAVSYQPKIPNTPIHLRAENKLLYVVMEELETLRNYPQACMEQTANKLWALVMLKKIKQYIKADKKELASLEKQMLPLQERLLKNQQFSGGWAWWEQGSINLYITGKVLQSLQQLDSTQTIYQAKRNGYLYIQNGLPKLGRAQKLEALLLLAEGNHVYPYGPALDTIPFDSLTVHQQWQMTRTAQKAGLPYGQFVQKLWKKRTETMFGGLYWGEENWYWQRNRTATTILAFRVFENSAEYRQYLPAVKQYFLEKRSGGYYQNTVEKAEICALLLPGALAEDRGKPASVQLSGGPAQTISQFPADIILPFNNNYQVSKSGNGLVYLSLYQQYQNRQPNRVDSLFDVRTAFVQNGDTLRSPASLKLRAGYKASLEVKLVVKKTAEFVQVDIPIPAGCWYAAKPQSWQQHREYNKDKVSIFIEDLPAGEYRYTIPLDVRFTGAFKLNPAKAMLMYFPVFYGREEMKEVVME